MTTRASRRPWMALLLAAALAAGLLALATAASEPADAAQFKTVIRTIDKPTTINIPEAGVALPYPSAKIVGAFPKGSSILDLNLRLKNFDHIETNNVDVMLAHQGVNRTVMSDAGGNNFSINSATLTLDDEAQTKLPEDGFFGDGGRFKPANYDGADIFPDPAPEQTLTAVLKAFDGKDPNGSWRLYVVDDEDFNGLGTVEDGYSLTIKAKVPTN